MLHTDLTKVATVMEAIEQTGHDTDVEFFGNIDIYDGDKAYIGTLQFPGGTARCYFFIDADNDTLQTLHR